MVEIATSQLGRAPTVDAHELTCVAFLFCSMRLVQFDLGGTVHCGVELQG